jgi:hypothetical protein
MTRHGGAGSASVTGGTASSHAPDNNKMQRTKPGQDGASPLILVLDGRQ